MIINNNNAASKAFVPYQSTLANRSQTAIRLEIGKRYADPSEGSGQSGVAARMKKNIAGTNSLLMSIQNGLSVVTTQDEVLGNVSDIVNRMTELATNAVDMTKSTSDRAALESEFRALSSEVADMAAKTKFNGSRLFETARTVRIGMESTDIISLSAIKLSALTFTSMSVSTVAAASAALVSLSTRVASLNVLRNQARGYSARLEKVMLYTRAYASNLSTAESAITDID